MNCQETPQLLHAYVDGELDLMKTLEVEQHLQECAACAQQRDGFQVLRTKLQTELPVYAATKSLRSRIRTSLRQSAPSAITPRISATRWFALAASVAVILFAGWGVANLLAPRGSEDLLVHDLVANHVRSRIPVGNHQFDVVSTDRHTVKPWLESQLDFSPPVQDLKAQGFPLVGGRLDYLDGRRVAALVYQRRNHIINLFVWPVRPGADVGAQTLTRQGYQLVHWTQAGMNFWAVSDLNAAELEEFARLMRTNGE